jgi:hypothetical protein
VIDISDTFAMKRAALECYASQFGAGAGGPATRLSRPTFLAGVEARARRLGELVGVSHAEGLVHAGALVWSGPLGGLFGEAGLAGGPTA